MPSEAHDEPDRNATDVVAERIGAQLVDLLVLFGQLLVFVTGLSALVRPEQPGTVRAFVAVGAFTLPLYGGLLEGYWNGQTVGKRLFGIRVVDRHGRDPWLGQAVLRNLPAVVLFSWITTAVALASMLVSPRRQRVFDVVAATYVVRA